jgi:anti-sigma factor (TIGR02949 family)
MALFDGLRRMFGSAKESGDCAAENHEGITCEEALRLVHDFIDGELADVSQAEVEAHFEVCAGCYPHLKLERSFREAVRRACAGRTAPPGLRERVLNIVSAAPPDA